MFLDLLDEHGVPRLELLELLHGDVMTDFDLLVHKLVFFELLYLPLEVKFFILSHVYFGHQVLIYGLVKSQSLLLGDSSR